MSQGVNFRGVLKNSPEVLTRLQRVCYTYKVTDNKQEIIAMEILKTVFQPNTFTVNEAMIFYKDYITVNGARYEITASDVQNFEDDYQTTQNISADEGFTNAISTDNYVAFKRKIGYATYEALLTEYIDLLVLDIV